MFTPWRRLALLGVVPLAAFTTSTAPAVHGSAETEARPLFATTTEDRQVPRASPGQGEIARAPVAASRTPTCYPVAHVSPAEPGAVPLPRVDPPLPAVPMPRLVPDCAGSAARPPVRREVADPVAPPLPR